jgi:hypothetical protein
MGCCANQELLFRLCNLGYLRAKGVFRSRLSILLGLLWIPHWSSYRSHLLVYSSVEAAMAYRGKTFNLALLSGTKENLRNVLTQL